MKQELEPKIQEAQEVPETNEKLSLNILAADDYDTNRRMFKLLFESLGHKVKIVEDGQLLVDELERNGGYDLIFSDNTMPVKKGVEALEEIRSKGNKIPFIIATTDSDGSLEKRIIDSDAFFLPKPFSRQQLSDAIDEVTKNKV